MSAVICGSLAFDTIMTFEGRFSEQILPDQLHILNVSFLVPALRREFGGCAGNIAYSLKQLGGTPLPMATLGSDGGEYVTRMQAAGISTEFVRQVDDSYTAQAMIMTDRDNNQITAFHPGAMMQAHISRIDARADIKLGIISPDGREALPMFDGQELLHFIELASWVTVNDYEAKLLCDRTGLSCAEISRKVQGLVVTLGAQGCEVWTDGEKTLVAPVQAVEVVDPTGCGDAFRGALLHGLEQGWPLAQCAALGNLVGALKIATRGGQNYTVDLTKIAASSHS